MNESECAAPAAPKAGQGPMKHACDETLDRIEPLLAAIRETAGLRERSRGVFYRKSTAFLHFHEDPLGLFADVRGTEGWMRLPVNTPAERRRLLVLVASHAGINPGAPSAR